MSLFPPIEPYNDLFLEVSDLHTIHVEEAGNPDGKPVVFVHGGPGGGIETIYRQYFDPERWRIVLFDQGDVEKVHLLQNWLKIPHGIWSQIWKRFGIFFTLKNGLFLAEAGAVLYRLLMPSHILVK